jgi:hypothetical protein
MTSSLWPRCSAAGGCPPLAAPFGGAAAGCRGADWAGTRDALGDDSPDAVTQA